MIKKIGKSALRVGLLSILCIVVLLLVKQHALIYFPHQYGRYYSTRLPDHAIELRYSTEQGEQLAFYVPPKSSAEDQPRRVWAMFAGNGSVALDWKEVVMHCPNTSDGFLLIDYPGYGGCEGSASPASIDASATKAVDDLAETLHWEPSVLKSKIDVIGHSIGCGSALNFAVHYPVQRVILNAPFTSLRDMARRTVGFPLCYLLLHNFDNEARLRELAVRPAPPKVTIFHGAEDTLIPPAMGRKLAELFPATTSFHEVPDADHNDVVFLAEKQIFAAMK